MPHSFKSPGLNSRTSLTVPSTELFHRKGIDHLRLRFRSHRKRFPLPERFCILEIKLSTVLPPQSMFDVCLSIKHPPRGMSVGRLSNSIPPWPKLVGRLSNQLPPRSGLVGRHSILVPPRVFFVESHSNLNCGRIRQETTGI